MCLNEGVKYTKIIIYQYIADTKTHSINEKLIFIRTHGIVQHRQLIKIKVVTKILFEHDYMYIII